MTPRTDFPGNDSTPAGEWLTLVLTTLQQVGLTMIRFGLPALVPFVRDDLGLSVLQVGVVLTALDLGSVLSFAPSYWALLVGLMVTGVGFPSGVTAGSKLVMRRFPPRTRGLAIGIRQSGLPVGGAVAAIVIPVLTGWGGWRAALAVIGLACALLAALCALLPRDGDVAATTDPAGTSPLRTLASDRAYRQMVVVGSLLMIGQFTLQGFLAVFLVDRYGWAPSAAGRLLALVHLGGIVGRLASGAASDLLTAARRKPVLIWILLGGIVLLLALARLPVGTETWSAVAVALAGGVFLAGWNGLFITLLTERAGAGRAATAIGASLTVMFLATMASYPIFGAVVQATGSYAPAWLLVASAQTAALLLLLRVQER
jgi:predicted MFS family arabinose efflux permease